MARSKGTEHLLLQPAPIRVLIVSLLRIQRGSRRLRHHAIEIVLVDHDGVRQLFLQSAGERRFAGAAPPIEADQLGTLRDRREFPGKMSDRVEHLAAGVLDRIQSRRLKHSKRRTPIARCDLQERRGSHRAAHEIA